MKLNKKTSIYIATLSVVAISLYSFLFNRFDIPSFKMLFFWSLLSIVVESLLIPLPNNTVGISVGYAINIASIIVGGPLLGATSAFLGFLFRVPKIKGRGYVTLFNIPIYKTIFNIVQSIIVTSSIGLIYVLLGGKIGQFTSFPTILILLLGTLFNTIIISGFLSLANDQKFIGIWINNVKGMLISAIAVGTMGIIIALAFISYGYGAVILFFGPLLLARFSFRLYVDMRSLYLSTIQALNKTIEAKDPYTSGHASRVEKYAVELAEVYGLSFEKIQDIRTASILHDIGKIGVNDNILNKTTKLTQPEFQEIMKHPSIGSEIISKVDFLKNIPQIVRYHHERYDGLGYPEGLAGDNIPIEACVLAIADSYDAMTSDRPYRKALDKKEALEEIRVNAGTQFHPVLAQVFVSMLSQ
ncbi:HD-GYP domain-containing protein [Proteiniborus sp. MB09-C3]|uniref:HD-GYP domain-containing protein n=1 Tax=Proteiniborus sp. MB09-C3 TaxID=3050072 RepID=UPI0025522584|nr:HD-GYP domain-containing protein [Proteiniborus sp. MB09-C3]WIV13827.1 HD-GYP domain-containing protein [Proteiniborus sp. MB09-C3]